MPSHFDGLRWYGPKALAFVRSQADAKFVAAGNHIVARARELVPVRTGRLRDSIGYTYNKQTLTLQIHVDEYYGVYVEYGTRFMLAQPYLRPALTDFLVWSSPHGFGKVSGLAGKLAMAFPTARNLKGTTRKPNPEIARRNRTQTLSMHRGVVKDTKLTIARGKWNGPKSPWRGKWRPKSA